MQPFLAALIECSVSMSVLILLFMAITPFLEKRYAAKWRYYAWLVIVIGLVIPFRPDLNTVLISMDVPTPPVNIQQIVPDNTATGGIGTDTVRPVLPTIRWYQMGFCLWMAGTAAVIAYHALRHRRFMRLLNRWCEEITNQPIVDTLQKLKKEMGISKEVQLKMCSFIQSPMLIGLRRPAILLPSASFHTHELVFILRHELVHLKRNDLWYKALVLLATAIHWFNPVVYLMAKAIAAQCEISCDERTLQGASFQQRKQYCETVIQLIKNGAKPQTSFSTSFYGGRNEMKVRIFSILDTTKKRTGLTIFGVVLIATLGTGIFFGANSPDEASTGKSPTSAAVSGESGMFHYSMDDYLEFLTKNEEGPVLYSYNGRWVRSLYDENKENGKPVLFFHPVEDEDVLGQTAIHLKTVRNQATNQIEKLVEMSEEEVFQLLGRDPDNLNIISMSHTNGRPEETEKKTTVTSTDNVSNEGQAANRIGPTKSKQVINIDVKHLKSGEFVCLGQYTLQKGDIITYNITAEGNGNLNVEYRKTADPRDNEGYLGHSGFAGNTVITVHSPMKVTHSLTGTYYLWIGNYHGESLKNIKGTVEISVEKTI